MLLLVDNFDSFTYNIAQAFQKLGLEVLVKRNNATNLDECRKLAPQFLVVGPGPGPPQSSGISQSLVEHFSGKIPIIGICLGMQLIGKMFGGSVIRSPLGAMHGKTSQIYHNDRFLFQGLPQGFHATRYHSLVVDRKTLPDCLEVTAETDKGEVMGVAHKKLPLAGVQFHPESVLTLEGEKLLFNFCSRSESIF